MATAARGALAKLSGRDGRRKAVSTPPRGVDLAALRRDLERDVRGEVRFDAGARALYANDFSLYRHVPLGLVVPRDADDVAAAVAACRRHGAPILPRGCGTGPSGQTVNVAVVFDYSKLMNEIVGLDPERRRARVRPGVICDQLRDAAEQHGLTYGPDPATHAYCTFGGMIGNNSCGTHSLMAGKTNDNVEELEVVLYDGTRMTVGATSEEELARIVAEGGRRGEIYRRLRDLRDRVAHRVREEFPDIPRRVSGYNLDELLPENGFHVARALVGSEGTCVNVLEATVRLVPSPPHRALVVLGYPTLFAAADHVPELLTHEPIGLEGFNDVLTENMEFKHRLREERARLPEGKAWLLAEFGAWTAGEARDQAQAALEAVERSGGPHLECRVLADAADQKMAWAVREAAVGDSRAPGALEAEGNWEDAAVHPDVLGAYLRDFHALVERHGYRCVYYGHFGQGCVHTRLDFDLKTAAGTRTFRSFMESAADLVLSYGGSLAGEYGEGQGRSELLPKMFGPELMDAFREFKAIWDPDAKMNPDRLIDAPPLDENLRLGVDYRPPALRTELAFPRDGASFAGAVERCFGMGKCRDPQPGYTMCPSFGATREEKHTTRGRARLLFEMLQGEVITDGWRSVEVRESLDLCLACKGCKTDCPTQTDMASLKAEFLSHHYRRRLRPRSAYALGLFPWTARLAARAPRLVNAATRAPVLGEWLKRLAGVTPERELPPFASETFRDWFAARGGSRNPGGRRVILWPDTFTNHLQPHVARAATEVLEAHGLTVELPPGGLCCGRPLYDFGMLSLARHTLRGVLDRMGDQIREGVPVVGLEPSCVAVFRDELVEMLPHDENAQLLRSQTFTLSEFLTAEVDDFRPPRLERRALVQAHCHHRAVMGFEADRSVLASAGIETDRVEVACCGLAGSFGYEREKYGISMRIGERGILPAVREAPEDTLVLADGFSCRSQIAHATGRRALHLAEVLRMGTDGGEPR